MRMENVALLVGYVPHDSRPSPWEEGSHAVKDQIVSCLEGCCANGDVDAAIEEEPSLEYLPAIGKHLGAYGCCNVLSIKTDVLPAVDLQDEPAEENEAKQQQKDLDNLAKERWCSDISLRLDALSIRVFGRLVVPKDFDARMHVDRHIYEYLIPVEALLTSAELQGDGARHKHLQQRLRPALESFRGKRSFHNYAGCTPEAVQGAGFSWLRKIHRVMCDGFFRNEDGQEFVVIAVEAKNVLPEQVRRMAGICVAAVRGLVTVQQVQRSLDSGVTMNVPCAPECYECLAQVVYEKYCWKNPASEHRPNEMHGWKFKKMRQQSKAWVREAMTGGDALARFREWLGHLDGEYTAQEEARENYAGEKLSRSFERLLGTGSGLSDPEADDDVNDDDVAPTHGASKSLLVIRTSNRTQGVFALELAVKLQEAGLPEGCLHDDLGIGLVVLSAPAEACCSSQVRPSVRPEHHSARGRVRKRSIMA
ncbi:hypothetical protein CYMTET_36885 [Cymbomonas tetramitiformis]|uniref:Uncharacterized protein n=1 Tax=Cymbomonas tetramitiformis TaxID=36881 RepID=A0AAE0CF41_9CHLO|nr:hypothetical protein CYMTET_36885 [Cymbomonas tetramitiformis]